MTRDGLYLLSDTVTGAHVWPLQDEHGGQGETESARNMERLAIKTSQQMLINPYPYRAVSYESPCLIMESSPGGGTERPGYFFDDFDSGHFGAWDTELAIEVDDFDGVIPTCRSMLQEYAKHAQSVLGQGRFANALRR